MQENKSTYDDNYETCYETYTTLSIYTKEINPNYITDFLNINASKIVIKDEKIKKGVNGWFLSSEEEVKSKDSRRHFDWILDIIYSKKEKLCELKEKGFDISISCFWSSMNGIGGPTLSPYQLRKLSDLDIEVFFEFYS